ncbi:hypothetical protein HK104_007009, partial [Borealophlyctis nickersoniae]
METFHGYINTPNDALLLFESCRLTQLKRVQRRLSESERLAYVRSGAIFVWDEEESGIKRWTDGKHWSPSRINGSFLIYREVEQRKTKLGLPPGVEAPSVEYVIKEGGLTKKAISINTANNRKQHLVSYYTREDVNSGRLKTPAELPQFADITISTEVYPEFMPDGSGASLKSSSSSIRSSGSKSSMSKRSAQKETSPHRASSDRWSLASSFDMNSGDFPRPSHDSGKYLSAGSEDN